MKNLCFLIAFIPSLLVAQHHIKGTLSPANAFTYALLYKATPTGANYVNQAKLESNGSFSISLNSNDAPGIYKIVYGNPPEANSFSFFYSAKEDVVLDFNLETGVTFINSVDNILWESYLNDISLINSQISDFYNSENGDKKAITTIFKNLKETQNSYEKAAENTIVLPFIKSNRTYIPQSFENVNTYSRNLKTHYFDSIAFDNVLLQSSDFLIERVMAYVLAMPSQEDFYQNAIDDIVLAIGSNKVTQMTLLEAIWQHMLETENDAVANYISDTYLLALARENQNELLLEVLLEYKATAVGHKAVDFEFSYSNQGNTIHTSLYDLDIAPRYVLVFWSSTCSHCLQELPILKSEIQKYPETKVIAFGLEDTEDSWQQTITNYPEFIHVLGLKKWDNPVVKNYHVNATPTYFVLDAEKIILSKPQNIEALKSDLKS